MSLHEEGKIEFQDFDLTLLANFVLLIRLTGLLVH